MMLYDPVSCSTCGQRYDQRQGTKLVIEHREPGHHVLVIDLNGLGKGTEAQVVKHDRSDMRELGGGRVTRNRGVGV